MLKKLRKSSHRVTLVLIGLGTLAGCGDERDSRRDVYASREDCLADWGNKPEDCTPATDRRHAGSGFFYGPLYTGRSGFSGPSWGASGSRPGSRSIGSTGGGSRSGGSSISRGGFGSSGHASSG